MTATTTEHEPKRGVRELRDGRVLSWHREVLAVLAFYVVYSVVRNSSGSNAAHARRDAKDVINLERHLGMFHETTIQHWALHWKPLIISANYFYGSLHFVVTIGVAVWMFRRYSNDYPRYRNILAATTLLALIGFTFFPLMPPRLIGMHGLDLGFVDTLERYPTFWSFDSGAAARVSNQYAAMPSVHIAWATWCALALVPRVKTTARRILAAGYPVLTLLVVVITANHYVLDAVGGLAILAAGWVIGSRITRAGRVEAARAVATVDP